jgi:hypothetical protein
MTEVRMTWSPKELQAWSEDRLKHRIAEGERLLREFELPWMREVVSNELARKRAILGVLQAR